MLGGTNLFKYFTLSMKKYITLTYRVFYLNHKKGCINKIEKIDFFIKLTLTRYIRTQSRMNERIAEETKTQSFFLHIKLNRRVYNWVFYTRGKKFHSRMFRKTKTREVLILSEGEASAELN